MPPRRHGCHCALLPVCVPWRRPASGLPEPSACLLAAARGFASQCGMSFTCVQIQPAPCGPYDGMKLRIPMRECHWVQLYRYL